MTPTLSLLAAVLQMAVQGETQPIALQIYSQGQHVGSGPVSIVVEVTNRSQHPVTMWKSPIYPKVESEAQSEKAPTSQPVAAAEPIYMLEVVCDRTPMPGQWVVEADGGHLVPFQQVTLAPGETMYAKATFSHHLVGQRAKVWVETSGRGTVSRSNELEFQPAAAK